MNEPTMETLARRLDRVERENRWFKKAGVVALALIAGVVLMGQATGGKVAKVIEAEEFVVRDQKGKMRAWLGTSEAREWVGLTLFTQDEDVGLQLRLFEDRPGLALYLNRVQVAEFSMTHNRIPALVLRDENGLDRAVLGHRILKRTPTAPVERRPASSIILIDKDGKLIWEAP